MPRPAARVFTSNPSDMQALSQHEVSMKGLLEAPRKLPDHAFGAIGPQTGRSWPTFREAAREKVVEALDGVGLPRCMGDASVAALLLVALGLLGRVSRAGFRDLLLVADDGLQRTDRECRALLAADRKRNRAERHRRFPLVVLPTCQRTTGRSLAHATSPPRFASIVWRLHRVNTGGVSQSWRKPAMPYARSSRRPCSKGCGSKASVGRGQASRSGPTASSWSSRCPAASSSAPAARAEGAGHTCRTPL